MNPMLKCLVSIVLFLCLCFLITETDGKKNRNVSKHAKYEIDQMNTTTLAFLPVGGISHIVDLIFESDESGDEEHSEGSENSLFTTSFPETVSSYEEILELENNEKLTQQETNKQKTHFNQRRRCNRFLIEYRVFNLIAKNKIPKNHFFSKWDKKVTQSEKINYLNKTLIKNNLRPLPNCRHQRLTLNLNPRKLNYFINILSTTVTNIKDTTLAQEITTTKLSLTTIIPSTKQELNQSKVNELLAQQKSFEQKISNLIHQGFLPDEALEKYQNGEISEEWLTLNVSKNRDFVMSQLPSKIQDLIISGKMPDDIEEAIFSGSLNRSAITDIIFASDEVVKMLLPKKVTDMLEDRPVPYKLKLIMMSGMNETEMANEVKNDTDLLQEMMSPSMFFFYTLFQVQRNRDINLALSVVLIVILTFVMISLGCTMTLQKIGEHARKPKGVIIALFAQFIMMPAAAFGLAKGLNLDVFSSMAVLICGCCPGGNLSNMLAYALSGDMNLSILMTTCSSVVGLGMMPLNIFLYSQFIVTVDSGEIVPFDKIVLNIALTIIPVGVGIGIRHFKPQWVPWAMRIGGISLVVGTILIGVLSGVMFGDAFFIYFPTPVLVCCAVLPISGYVFGYLFAWIAREKPKCRRTICVETGCQNVQLCSTVLKLAFDPILVGVLFLMPLVYMCFQVSEAFLLIFGFKLYNRCKGKKKVVDDDTEEKKKSDLESSDEKKKSYDDEEKNLLDIDKSNTENPTNTNPNGKEKDEAWPLDGKPKESYLESLKTAGTEHLF